MKYIMAHKHKTWALCSYKHKIYIKRNMFILFHSILPPSHSHTQARSASWGNKLYFSSLSPPYSRRCHRIFLVHFLLLLLLWFMSLPRCELLTFSLSPLHAFLTHLLAPLFLIRPRDTLFRAVCFNYRQSAIQRHSDGGQSWTTLWFICKWVCGFVMQFWYNPLTLTLVEYHFHSRRHFPIHVSLSRSLVKLCLCCQFCIMK